MPDKQSHQSIQNVSMLWRMVALGFAGLLVGLVVSSGHSSILHRISQSSPPGTVQQAHRDFEQGDDAVAIRLFRTLAEKNNPQAEYWLGYMTEQGLGTTRDVQKAISLYREAADRNVAAAQLRLGEIYLHGNLVLPDSGLARTYLERAAYQGERRAAMLVGRIYRVGIGTAPDPVKAYAWSEVATIEGSAAARRQRDASLRGLDAKGQQSAVARAKTILAKVQDDAGPIRSAAAAPDAPASPTRPASAVPNA